MFLGDTPGPAGEAPLASSEEFRAAMRELASGVALVTTLHDGQRAGCVVSSFASLSLTPPSLLICLSATSSTLARIRASGVFAVNILAHRHEALARRFSDPAHGGPERFAQGDWGALATGAPTLRDALAVVDCRLEREIAHATHAILIGAAFGVARGPAAPALVHRKSHFEALA